MRSVLFCCVLLPSVFTQHNFSFVSEGGFYYDEYSDDDYTRGLDGQTNDSLSAPSDVNSSQFEAGYEDVSEEGNENDKKGGEELFHTLVDVGQQHKNITNIDDDITKEVEQRDGHPKENAEDDAENAEDNSEDAEDIKENAEDINENAEDINENAEDIKKNAENAEDINENAENAEDINDNTESTEEDMENINENAEDIKDADADSSRSPDKPFNQDDCSLEEFGCCQDGEHPAHGDKHLGCCTLSEYGCCPGFITAADGPYFQGCDCAESEFGCCPDQLTPAAGPGMVGCGCQYTQHGCCQDKITQALGFDLAGCSCDTYRYGCCPDGINHALGSNLEGCNSCADSKYGCCQDELTPATGSDFQGCGCESSKFGCCLDGSSASGANFMGCFNVPGENCHLSAERGGCSDYEEKWYYNMDYGGCDRFWFGGCEAGKNHFNSQEDCQGECVSPRGSAVCYLKPVVGPCKGTYMEWFYDVTTRSCKQFSYGGCLGNGNRFSSKETCENMCHQEQNQPICSKRKGEGACSGDFPRWYFDNKSGSCEEFSFSGCMGNNNRFMNKDDCENACRHMKIKKASEEVCSLFVEEGSCTQEHNQTKPKWGYSQKDSRCMPFYWSGCGGNKNNFPTLGECEAMCPSTSTPAISFPQGKEILLQRGSRGAMIQVSIKSNPPAVVTWKTQVATLSESSRDVAVLPDNSLLIDTVSDYSAGIYTVTAYNKIGDPVVDSLRVIVYPIIPTMSLSVDKTIYKPGSDIVLLCAVKGYPIPGIVWKKKAYNQPEEILATNNKLNIETFNNSTLEVISRLILRDVSDKDTATYSCNVETDFTKPIIKSRSVSVQYGPGERCVDSVTFAKYCPVVVQNHKCGSSYYGRHCCRSCASSGYLAGGRKP